MSYKSVTKRRAKRDAGRAERERGRGTREEEEVRAAPSRRERERERERGRERERRRAQPPLPSLARASAFPSVSLGEKNDTRVLSFRYESHPGFYSSQNIAVLFRD